MTREVGISLSQGEVAEGEVRLITPAHSTLRIHLITHHSPLIT